MQHTRGRCGPTLAIAALITAGGAAFSAHPVVAATQVNCTSSATVKITPSTGGTYLWTVQGAGSCSDTQATQKLHFHGKGTSQGLGSCSGGQVNNLNLAMTLKFRDATSGVVRTISETWGQAQTNYPGTTPFTITEGGASVGSGVITTHIFGNCPPNGTASARIDFNQST